MDSMVRKTGSHQDFDTNSWMSALGVDMSISGIAETMLRKAFEEHEDDGQQNAPSATTLQAVVQSLASTIMAAIRDWIQYEAAMNGFFHTLPPAEGTPIPGVATPLSRIDFQVHSDTVSIHIPLHRFLARLILTCSQRGLAIPQLPMDDNTVALALMDLPLRCLVVTAQISNGQMWRRNGISVQGQALHYITPPVCRLLRDLDIVLMQYCAVTGSFDLFLSLLLDRFNLDKWFQDLNYVPVIEHVEPKQIAAVAEECLLSIILLVTELPPPPGALSLCMYRL